MHSNIFECMRMPFESHNIEYKRLLNNSSKLAREAIALANSQGGKIVVGYDQKQDSFYDIKPTQQQEEWIANVLSDLCQPRIQHYVSYQTQVEIQGSPTLLVIDIPEGTEKPYKLSNKSIEEGTYIRVGSTSRLANRDEIARLIRQGKNIPFDSESTTLNRSELSTQLLTEYFKARNEVFNAPIPELNDKLLLDLGIMEKSGRLTVAGALLFTEHPQSISMLQSAFVKIARFKGITKGLFIDRREINGPLINQLNQAHSFCLRNIRLSSSIEGTERNDTFEYRPDIIREALVNAIVHRDYSIQGSSIMVAIFDDRIEVTSPGGLPGQITVHDIRERQFSRNPSIAKRMFEYGVFDAWGQGIDKIIAWSENQGTRLPEFVENNEQFTLRIFSSFTEEAGSAKSPAANNTLTSERQLSGELVKRANAILELAQKTQISNKLVQEKLGISKGQAQVVLSHLVKNNSLLKIGKGKNTGYILKRSA